MRVRRFATLAHSPPSLVAIAVLSGAINDPVFLPWVNRLASQPGRDNAMCHTAYSTADA